MGIKILKAGLLGFVVVFLLLCIFSFVLPSRFAGWSDGFPWGTASSTPGLGIGSLVGVVVGVIIGRKRNNIQKIVFLATVCGGVIGALVSWFINWGYDMLNLL